MAKTREKTVFLVGPLASLGNVLSDASASHGMRMHGFPSVEECRKPLSEGDCDLLVVDLNGDTVRGLDILAELEQTCPHTLKLALVDHGDIATAVQAIKAGATDCLEKPVDGERLITGINDLLRQTAQDLHHSRPALTPTEETVLQIILEGKTNCETARALHRSPRTIEVHRGHIMHKLGVSNMVDLVKTAASMGLCSVFEHQTPGRRP